MIEGLLGRKLGMTQIFDARGETVPVTVLEVGPCVVTQILTEEKNGYSAVQLGFGHKKRLNEPERGHLKASGAQSRHLREMKNDGAEAYEGADDQGRLLRGRRPDRRDRHLQGQGLRGRGQAPRLRRRPEDPR